LSDLDKFGVPRQLSYRQTVSRTDDIVDRTHRRTETVRQIAHGSQFTALDLHVLCAIRNTLSKSKV